MSHIEPIAGGPHCLGDCRLCSVCLKRAIDKVLTLQRALKQCARAVAVSSATAPGKGHAWLQKEILEIVRLYGEG